MNLTNENKYSELGVTQMGINKIRRKIPPTITKHIRHNFKEHTPDSKIDQTGKSDNRAYVLDISDKTKKINIKTSNSVTSESNNVILNFRNIKGTINIKIYDKKTTIINLLKKIINHFIK